MLTNAHKCVIMSATKKTAESFRRSLVGKSDDIVGRAADYAAQLFHGEQGDIAVFLEGIERLIIDAALEQLILGHIQSLHGFPQRSVVNNCSHLPCMIYNNYIPPCAERILWI